MISRPESTQAVSGNLVPSRFGSERDELAAGAQWRGFTDRVMGGLSDADGAKSFVEGRHCIRMTGRVTRDRGGGFIQMALDPGGRSGALDASACRATIQGKPAWTVVRLPWADCKPNDLAAPPDLVRLQRIAVLGWMRDFRADLSLAELSLYRQA